MKFALQGPHVYELEPDFSSEFVMSCKRVRMERSYTNITYDPFSKLYVGASAMSVPYQIYSDECVIIEDSTGKYTGNV